MNQLVDRLGCFFIHLWMIHNLVDLAIVATQRLGILVVVRGRPQLGFDRIAISLLALGEHGLHIHAHFRHHLLAIVVAEMTHGEDLVMELVSEVEELMLVDTTLRSSKSHGVQHGQSQAVIVHAGAMELLVVLEVVGSKFLNIFTGVVGQLALRQLPLLVLEVGQRV